MAGAALGAWAMSACGRLKLGSEPVRARGAGILAAADGLQDRGACHAARPAPGLWAVTQKSHLNTVWVYSILAPSQIKAGTPTRRLLPPGQAIQREQQMAAVKRMGVKMGHAVGHAVGQTVGLTVGKVVSGRMQEPESWIVGIGGLTLLGLALGVLG